MQPERLTRMANQIATFFASQHGDAAAAVAAHLNAFWDPRMRRAFLDHVAAGGEGLDPLVLAAAPLVRRPAEAA